MWILCSRRLLDVKIAAFGAVEVGGGESGERDTGFYNEQQRVSIATAARSERPQYYSLQGQSCSPKSRVAEIVKW